MHRTLLFAALLIACTIALAAQGTSVLHIRVTLADASGHDAPVARHRLLIGDNPASEPPREVLTGADGTVDVKLRPGNYTVESDEPIIRQGKAYRWTQMVDIRAGIDARLELTSANVEAEAEPVRGPAEMSGTALLAHWESSVVALWGGNVRSSGFVVDARGLVATSERAVSGLKDLEVQLSPELKVAGRVLAAEPGRDVAIVQVHPSALAAVAPVPLACDDTTPPAPKEKDRAIGLGAPLRGAKAGEYGVLGRIGPHVLETDMVLATGGLGGPAFLPDGRVIGLTSTVDGTDERRPDFRIIRTPDVCAVLTSALKSIGDPPSPERLPVEPTAPFPQDALEAAAQQLAGSRNPYQGASADFDVAFITPAQVYAARRAVRPKSLPSRPNRTPVIDPYDEARQHAMLEFGRWSEYFDEVPPVLLVRVTPRMVQGFWRALARGAAMSQGFLIPALKHFKSSFVRMRAFCGADEVRPIHPFTLTTVVSAQVSVTEGLYVFHPNALGPRCGTVKLQIYSEQSPDRADTLTMSPKAQQRLWDEFAAWRGR